MELKIEKSRVLSAADKCSTVKEVLSELFPEVFKKKDFRSIKTFDDACESLDINPNIRFLIEAQNDEIAYKKLKIIIKAINQGWQPNWNDTNQCKWYPYFNLSSGFGFSDSDCYYDDARTDVGSRLCFETEEKANYAGKQFLSIYKDFLTLND
jgi:hypothetical protein